MKKNEETFLEKSIKWEACIGWDMKNILLTFTDEFGERQLHLYEIFFNAIFVDDNEFKEVYVHTRKGCSVEEEGEKLKTIRFVNGQYQEIHILLEDKVCEIPLAAIKRLSFFAMTDDGVILVSYYPNLKDFAREMIMVKSYMPFFMALSQHMASSWFFENFARREAIKNG